MSTSTQKQAGKLDSEENPENAETQSEIRQPQHRSGSSVMAEQ
jgi:hypothetical protein